MSLYINGKKIKQVLVMKNDGTAATCVPGNIKSDVPVYGVVGSYTSEGTQSAGQTLATSDDIVQGKSAWADGEEVMGSLVVNEYFYGESIPDSSLGKEGDIYLKK